MLLGFFKDKDNSYIRRISLNSDLATQIDQDLKNQVRNFFFDGDEEKNIVDFYPGETSSEVNISRIEFDDPDGLYKEAQNPSLLALDPKKDLNNLVAIFCLDPDNDKRILIQLVEHRRLMLPKSGWLIFKDLSEKEFGKALSKITSSNTNGTLVEMEEMGLRLDNKLTAVYDGQYLYFKSFFQINRIFDLSDYLVEATDETIRDFLNLECISAGDDIEETLKIFSTPQRKKIAKVMALGFAKKYSAVEIANRALKSKKIIVKVENSKIKIPDTARERGMLLQFLANGIMMSYLDDDNDYQVESMRPMN